MRLGTYLGIAGTLFGNLLVAVILVLVTSGHTYPNNPSMGQAGGSIDRSNSSSPADIGETDTKPAEAIGSIAQECALSSAYPEKILKWCELITEYARQNSLPPNLVAAVVLQESGGNPDAISHSGAIGLMQIMPRDGIAAQFMCVNGPCFSNRPTSQQLFDPEFNIAFGTRLLASLAKRHGSLREALKAYGPMDAGYSYADLVLSHYKQHED